MLCVREFKLGIGLYTVGSRYIVCVYTNERDHMWQTESILLTVVTSLCVYSFNAILKHKHCIYIVFKCYRTSIFSYTMPYWSQ